MNRRLVRIQIAAVLNLTAEEEAAMLGQVETLVEDLTLSPEFPTSDVVIRIEDASTAELLVERRQT